MLKHRGRAPRARIGGFSLVEMMVALVVGLIVIGAVLALIMSMVRANNQTIQATRLTQELRATAAVIAADLKRADGVGDPFLAAKTPTDFAVAVPSASCITYGYQDPATSVRVYRAVRLNGSKVDMFTSNALANIACNKTGQSLSSAQVNIVANPGAVPMFSISGRRIVITLTGTLANPGIDGNITRTLSQTVFVRSIGS